MFKNKGIKKFISVVLFSAITNMAFSGEIKYLNNRSIKVLNGTGEQKKSIDTLDKGTRVEILEEGENYVKIRYKKDLKVREGWIPNKDLVDDLVTTLPQHWSKLDFNKQDKVEEYPQNEKVEVKGIYVSLHSAASTKKLEKLIDLTRRTEINAFVIDVKDDLGTLLFKMEGMEKYNPDANKGTPLRDIENFMRKMKENNIYTIARIVSFKDPSYSKHNKNAAIIDKQTGQPFTNKDGVIWVSPHDRHLWEYNIAVAKKAAEVGFNEIQFDYVRFPASNGGKLDTRLDYRSKTKESKPETIQNYLKYAREELSPLGVYISADVYGQVGTFPDDMALGQHWESVSNIVDYISPMKYPSHYGNGAYGIAVPDAQPYKTIYKSTRDSVNRNNNIENPAVIRPWIQAFTAPWVKGHIKYGPNEIQQQIQAMKDLGVKEYLLWSPSNNYNIK
jgi:hypothetical protein